MDFQQLSVNFQHEVETGGHRDSEWIDTAGRGPAIDDLVFGCQLHVLPLAQRAGPSDFDRLGCGAVDGCAAKIVRRGKAPGAIGDHADTQALRLRFPDLRWLVILGGKIALPDVHYAHVCVAGASGNSSIQGYLGEFSHI